MQISLKTVAAAGALALASVSAFAAPPVVPSQPVPITNLNVNSQSGDPLYVAVWDSLTGKSLVQYLGLNFGQVGIADMTANLNFGTLSGFGSTFTGSTSGLQFEVFSNSYNPTTDATTILTTSRDGLIESATDANATQAIFTAGQVIGDWTTNRMLAANTCNKANSCIGTDFNDVKSFAGGNFSDNYGGSLTGAASGVHTSGFVGGPGLAFYSLANSTNTDPFGGTATVSKYSGTWSLSAAGLLTYDVGGGGGEVPLPAAVWLLLSGLGSMGVIGRRRALTPVAA